MTTRLELGRTFSSVSDLEVFHKTMKTKVTALFCTIKI